MTESEAIEIFGQPKLSREMNGQTWLYFEKGAIVVMEQGKLFNAVLSTGASLDNPKSLK
jgi:hypothetical protein